MLILASHYITTGSSIMVLPLTPLLHLLGQTPSPRVQGHAAPACVWVHSVCLLTCHSFMYHKLQIYIHIDARIPRIWFPAAGFQDYSPLSAGRRADDDFKTKLWCLLLVSVSRFRFRLAARCKWPCGMLVWHCEPARRHGYIYGRHPLTRWRRDPSQAKECQGKPGRSTRPVHVQL